MTAKEQLTLQEFIEEYRRDKAADAAWKQDVKDKLDPLVKERLDRMILAHYGGYVWKAAVAIVGFIASIGIAYNYWVRSGAK